MERRRSVHLRDLLLELGRGFAFIGSQIPIKVGGQTFYFDLRFYHVDGTITREVNSKLDLKSTSHNGRKGDDFRQLDHMYQSPAMRVRSGLNSVPWREGIFHTLEARFEPGKMPQQKALH
jgi:YhcG PDDEXK nuclease domain